MHWTCRTPTACQFIRCVFKTSFLWIWCLKHLQTNEFHPQTDVIEEDDDSGDGVDSGVSELLSRSTVAHSCRATVPCEWINQTTQETCGTEISCNTISDHFRDTHGIRGVEGSTVRCLFKGCHKRVGGKNFTRHIREPHLSHPRVKKSHS